MSITPPLVLPYTPANGLAPHLRANRNDVRAGVGAEIEDRLVHRGDDDTIVADLQLLGGVDADNVDPGELGEFLIVRVVGKVQVARHRLRVWRRGQNGGAGGRI